MPDDSAEIDRLLHLLSQADDTASRDEISEQLALLYRKKVLSWDGPSPAEEWMPIPSHSFGMRSESITDPDVKVFVKGVFRALAAGMDADGHKTPDEFVALCRCSTADGAVTLCVTCPYEHPLRLLRDMRSGPRMQEVRSLIAEKSATLDINHNYGLPEGVSVPVVFSRSPDKNEVLLMNRHHLTNPGQFLAPARCTTTSGFLNHIGALEIDHLVNGRKNFYIPAPESMMNKGLDDWFRWLYWLMDTGIVFESARMYVSRANPEQYAYRYGELAED